MLQMDLGKILQTYPSNDKFELPEDILKPADIMLRPANDTPLFRDDVPLPTPPLLDCAANLDHTLFMDDEILELQNMIDKASYFLETYENDTLASILKPSTESIASIPAKFMPSAVSQSGLNLPCRTLATKSTFLGFLHAGPPVTRCPPDPIFHFS